VVGFWGGERNYENILVRLRSAGASYLTTSLTQTASQVQALLGIAVPASLTNGQHPTQTNRITK
jgi:hypothetical protein